MSTFRDWIEDLHSGAAWLRGEYADAFFGTFALFVDYVQEGARLAVRARFPSEAPADALPEIAHAMRIRTFTRETVASLRVALRQATTIHRERGTRQGVLAALARVQLPTAQLYEGFQWPTRPPQPWPSQFWIVLPSGAWGAAPSTATVGSGVLVGSGALVGVTGITSTDITDVRGSIKWAKRAGSICREIITVISGTIVGTGVLVGSGATVGGSAVIIAGA